MITITPVKLSELNLDYITCPNCGSKIAMKPKNTKVLVFKVSKPPTRKQNIVQCCKQCKSYYIIDNIPDNE